MTIRSNAPEDEDFSRRAGENQTRLRNALKPDYDFIVCGAGASGSVVARRLAENPDVQVLLVEAGGSDAVDSVLNPSRWPVNLGSERDWGYQAQPNPNLNNRALPMSMGKVLGGGSSINVTVWARGHRSDWDFIAAETADPSWGYESVLDIYRRIEDWQGAPDPRYRGTGGGEAMPGDLSVEALTNYIRNAAVTYWHQTCTAKMGRDPMAVVDASLKVHGIQGLRVADGSVLPRLPTGNTQAPCAIIGERAAQMLKEENGLAGAEAHDRITHDH